MTIPEIEEALKSQQAILETLSKAVVTAAENIKELRHQIGVPCAPQCGPEAREHPDPFRR